MTWTALGAIAKTQYTITPTVFKDYGKGGAEKRETRIHDKVDHNGFTIPYPSATPQRFLLFGD